MLSTMYYLGAKNIKLTTTMDVQLQHLYDVDMVATNDEERSQHYDQPYSTEYNHFRG